MNLKRLMGICASLALALSFQGPASAQSIGGPQTLVVGVDHVDLANQQPQDGRVFEYTDFFSRAVSVHTGDTINFQAAPGSFHIVALAADEAVARQVYPVAFPDTGDPFPAPGTGLPKIVLGPSNFSITGGSVHGGGIIGTSPFGPPPCGVPGLGEQNCTFSGPSDIEVAGPNPGVDQNGNPAPADWLININAPPGQYHFFCYIHPGMRGDLTVVGAHRPTTTQAQINEESKEQFQADRNEALAAEQGADVVRFRGGAPGTRTYFVHVGIGVPDNRVAIDEMLPRKALDLTAGDQVKYLWDDPHNVHTVSFPASSPDLRPPFGFDCGNSFSGAPDCNDPAEGAPEFIADPGTSPPGTVLTTLTALVDSGLLAGTGYGISPSAQTWSARVAKVTATGAHRYQCTVHDFMQGTINVK